MLCRREQQNKSDCVQGGVQTDSFQLQQGNWPVLCGQGWQPDAGAVHLNVQASADAATAATTVSHEALPVCVQQVQAGDQWRAAGHLQAQLWKADANPTTTATAVHYLCVQKKRVCQGERRCSAEEMPADLWQGPARTCARPRHCTRIKPFQVRAYSFYFWTRVDETQSTERCPHLKFNLIYL
jgi:hypothetical protein